MYVNLTRNKCEIGLRSLQRSWLHRTDHKYVEVARGLSGYGPDRSARFGSKIGTMVMTMVPNIGLRTLKEPKELVIVLKFHVL